MIDCWVPGLFPVLVVNATLSDSGAESAPLSEVTGEKLMVSLQEALLASAFVAVH
jgi:hypothetical protein